MIFHSSCSDFSNLHQLYGNFRTLTTAIFGLTDIIRQLYGNFWTLTYGNFRTYGNYTAILRQLYGNFTAILRQFYGNFRTLNFQIWFRSNSDLIQIWSASLGKAQFSSRAIEWSTVKPSPPKKGALQRGAP